MSKKILSMVLCVCMLVTILSNDLASITVHAFSNYKVVTTENTTIRKDCYQDSKKVKDVKQGTTLTVTGEKKNKYDNLWYKVDGGYIFSGKVKDKVSTKSATYQVIATENAKIRSSYYETASVSRNVAKGEVLKISQEVTNKYDNLWYKVDGGYIYSGRVKEYVVYKDVNFGVIATQDTTIRKGFYDSTSVVRNVKKDEVFKVTQEITNKYGNLWYKVSDGYIYSGKVKDYTTTKDASYKVITKQDAVIRNGFYETASVSRNVKKGEVLKVSQEVINKYGNLWFKVDGGYIYSERVKENVKTVEACYNLVVTKDAPIRQGYYEIANVVRNVKKGATLEANGQITNKYDNVWYKVDGGYIYSGNVSLSTANIDKNQAAVNNFGKIDPAINSELLTNSPVTGQKYDMKTGKVVDFSDLEKMSIEEFSNTAHTTLDVCGLVPAAGAYCDGVNVAYYLVERKWAEAFFSGIALIPIVGIVSTSGKFIAKAKKVSVVASKVDNVADDVAKEVVEEVVEKSAKKVIIKNLDNVTPVAKNILENSDDYSKSTLKSIKKISENKKLNISEVFYGDDLLLTNKCKSKVTSKANLKYHLTEGENTIDHIIFRHAADSTEDASKFMVKGEDVFDVIDDVVVNGQEYLSKPSRGKIQKEFYANKVIGTKGETKLRVIMEDGYIVTAFPIK